MKYHFDIKEAIEIARCLDPLNKVEGYIDDFKDAFKKIGVEVETNIPKFLYRFISKEAELEFFINFSSYLKKEIIKIDEE